LAAALRNELLGLSPEDVLKLPERLEAIDPDSVRAALTTHLSSRNIVVVLVATADEYVPRLRRTWPEAQVHVVDFREGLEL